MPFAYRDSLTAILAQDPAGGPGVENVARLIEFIYLKGPYIVIGFFVAIAAIMALSMIEDRIRKRRRK